MIMTNYMELLATNQPWNLILFMVIPVTLAEALVATEFYTVYLGDKAGGRWRQVRSLAGNHCGNLFHRRCDLFAYACCTISGVAGDG